jgi:hypothetical protein
MDFEPNNILPNDVLIDFAANHLYRIGLIPLRDKSIKRKRYENPVFKFIINLHLIIRFIISLQLSEENEYIFLLIGDFTYFLKARIHFNTAASLIISIALFSQLVQYYNYKNDIKPSYLKLFEMLSGLRSPKSIGLTDKEEIYKFAKLSKLLFTGTEFFAKIVMPFLFFLLTFLSFSLKCSLKELILYALPHCLKFAFCAYSVYSIIFWQIIYYYLICQYLKCKLKTANNSLRKLSDRRVITYKKVLHILEYLDSIYEEIDDYNSNYWSKFLFIIWITFAAIINTGIYFILFIEMNSILKIIFIYFTIQTILILLLIINTTASVNSKANKSYSILNSCMTCLNRRMQNINKFNCIKIKV